MVGQAVGSHYPLFASRKRCAMLPTISRRKNSACAYYNVARAAREELTNDQPGEDELCQHVYPLGPPLPSMPCLRSQTGGIAVSLKRSPFTTATCLERRPSVNAPETTTWLR